MIVALLVLYGWYSNNVLLKQVAPKMIAMNPATAVAFLFTGLSYLLLLLFPSPAKFQRLLINSTATAVLFIATVKLLAVAGIYDAGIDRWLYTEKINTSLYNQHPNSMVPQSAIAFVCISISLLLLNYRKITLSQYVCLPVVLVGLLSVIGYTYHVTTVYHTTTFIPMSFHSGVCFLVLSTALLFTKNKEGFIGEITNPHAGGKAARFLFPACIVVPFVLGLLIVIAVLNGLISIVAGVSVLVTAITFVFGFIIWVTARIINRSESERLQEREASTEKLQQFNQELESKVNEQTRHIIEQEQYFRLLLENIREGVQIISHNWEFLFVNKSAAQQHRLEDEKKMTGLNVTQLYPAFNSSTIFRELQTCMQQKIPKSLEFEHEFPDEVKKYFYLSVQPVPEGLFILSTDITAQKLAKKKYRETQERYQILINSVDGIVWEADIETFAFSFVSQQAERLLGYPVERWTNDPDFWTDHIYEEDRKWATDYCKQCTLEQKSHQFEYRMVAADGRIVWMRDVVSIQMKDNKPVMLSGIMVDITEAKQMEQVLAAKMISQQKIITETAILAQEKERNQLGLELHDNINQLLSVVRLYLGMMKTNGEADMSIVDKSYVHLDEAIHEIRKLSHSLVAPSLGKDGLKEAMNELVENVSKANNISILFFADDDYPKQSIDKNKELMLYRIAQEQLTNIIKYAHASDVHIHLKQVDGFIYLSINDNGVGFIVEETGTGIGLKNINSRVDFYSGKMQLTSAPGEGCTLEVYIPL
jgi:PAS domain S-box-containing protein